MLPTKTLLIRGDDTHAYRDPAVYYKDGIYRLYMTLVETESDGGVYMYIAESRSTDLADWTAPKKLTVRDRSKNFSSPGNIVCHDGRYIMCHQSYCREHGEKYGNDNCRVYFSESRDLETWSEPYPVRLKGGKPISELGRMIDPYLIYDRQNGLWNCFYKQNGISRSVSRDLVGWEYLGSCDGGENVSIINVDGLYHMFHSPSNGIGHRVSTDLCHWQELDTLYFGQRDWIWARGRLTAGAVVKVDDLYLMFFHGTGPENEDVIFDTHACIGLAWSHDLVNWDWRE